MMSRTFASAAALTLAALLQVGCAADSTGNEDIGVATEAFGEGSCETATPDATESVGLGIDQTSSLHTSSSSTYGTSNCTESYLVEYDASGSTIGTCVSNNHIHLVSYGWPILPLTQAICEKAHQRAVVWKHSGGSWSNIGEEHYRGHWDGTSCSFSVQVLDTLTNAGDGGDELRVGVQAFTCSIANVDNCVSAGGTKTLQQVEQRIGNGDCTM